MEAKIKLKVKDVEIELSIDEAKELKQILEGLTGKEIVREVHHDHWHESFHDWWYRRYPEVTWSCKTDNTSNAIFMSNKVNDIQVTYSVG